MTRVNQNFEIWTGEDKLLRFTILDADGASVAVAGFTCNWVLQDEPDSGSLIEYWTGGSGITLSGCTVDVNISASDTVGCALSGTYYHELAASDLSSNISVLAVGYAQIHRRGY